MIGFKLCAILSSVMKCHAILLHPTWNANHLFVQCSYNIQFVRIGKNHSIYVYKAQCYLQLQASIGGLGTYAPWKRQDYCTVIGLKELEGDMQRCNVLPY